MDLVDTMDEILSLSAKATVPGTLVSFSDNLPNRWQGRSMCVQQWPPSATSRSLSNPSKSRIRTATQNSPNLTATRSHPKPTRQTCSWTTSSALDVACGSICSRAQWRGNWRRWTAFIEIHRLTCCSSSQHGHALVHSSGNTSCLRTQT